MSFCNVNAPSCTCMRLERNSNCLSVFHRMRLWLQVSRKWKTELWCCSQLSPLSSAWVATSCCAECELHFQIFREYFPWTVVLQCLPRRSAVNLMLSQRNGAPAQGWRDNLLDLMKGSTRRHIKVIFKGIADSIFGLDSDFKTRSQVRYYAGNLSLSIPNCNSVEYNL